MRLPSPLIAPIEALLDAPKGLEVDFSSPPGAEALVPAGSVSWDIFGNGTTLFIGGVAAVILELAEPSVRAGVWDHSSFRKDPLLRLRRTGAAAMITVYAPRAEAEAMIRRVVAMHDRVEGRLDDGTPYHANDPVLLDWVQATASFGFLQAYHCFARRLSDEERSRAFAEGAVAARLYGATGAPRSLAEWEEQLNAMLPRLEQGEVLDEFLDIMRSRPLLPGPARFLQPLLVRAAISTLPKRVQEHLGLADDGLRRAEWPFVRALAQAAERLELPNSPKAQSERRMAERRAA